MTTYYAAQLGIALSVVDSKATYIKEEEARKVEAKKKDQAPGSMQSSIAKSGRHAGSPAVAT